jgi:F-type H+-transporting ATPase subunit gamma
MARTREIKKRIGAVGTIQRITKTMQMIATAKFTTAAQRAHASKPYTEKMQGLVAEALAGASDFEHPLMAPPVESPRRELLLAIASNRGLCGAYNANVLRTAMGHIRGLRAGGRVLDLETAGRKAVGYFRFQKVAIARRHTIADQPPYDQVEPLAERYIEEFIAGRHDAVRVASMQFVSNTRQVPRVIQLLPLQPASGDTEAPGPAATYEFSPSAEAILGELLPLVVKTALFQAFLDAAVSEHITRMVAMKAATDNAGELGRMLVRRFNRARQTQITTELMEIIGGAAALA